MKLRVGILGYRRKDYSAVSLLYQDAACITIATGRHQRHETSLQ